MWLHVYPLTLKVICLRVMDLHACQKYSVKMDQKLLLQIRILQQLGPLQTLLCDPLTMQLRTWKLREGKSLAQVLVPKS